MTFFEIFYTVLRPSVVLALHQQVHSELKSLAKEKAGNGDIPEILDIGGRKSRYTIGVNANITIGDLPRVSEIQKSLNLGITDQIVLKTKQQRSNIVSIVYDDMTHSEFKDNSFDIIVAVEVLEHVREDEKFVSEVFRVLKPGGFFYMTTPNGDKFPIPHNPDHVRHYKKAELQNLLENRFKNVQTKYAVLSGKRRTRSLEKLIIRKPIKSIRRMWATYLNYKESMQNGVDKKADSTAHLIAICQK